MTDPTPDANDRCTVKIWPSWAPEWIPCGSKLTPQGCAKYGAMHARKADAARPNLPPGSVGT